MFNRMTRTIGRSLGPLRSLRSLRLLAVIACVAALVSACGGTGSGEGTSAAAKDPKARQAALKQLEEQKRALDAKREELASLRDQQANGAEVDAQIDATRTEIDRMSDELGKSLVEYINADPPVVGEPMRPDQQAAIRMKSAEDMMVARDFIERGGDYRKAVDIYNSALAIDPDNAELQAALKEAEQNRFMTRERFAAVKKGMTEAEVVAAIGRPYYKNIREYPEKKVTAWFYTKNDANEAAGVFFNSEKKTVYSTDFDAIKRNQAAAGD